MTKIEHWMQLSDTLKSVKEEEAKLRREICDSLFKGKVGEFREKAVIDGYTVVATSKVNRTVDKAVLTSLWEALSEDEKACIEFKPDLKLTNYRKLNDNDMLHEAITVKPGMPTLEVKD